MKRFNVYNSQLESAVDLTDKAKLSLYKKSSNSGISVDILEEVYYRGYVMWNEEFGGTAESFAFDRVNSFVAGGYAAELDSDLLKQKAPIKEDAEKHSKDKNDPASRFVGSDELVAIYAKDTPGQVVKKIVKEARLKLNELSPETLGSYVTAAEKQMTKIKAKDPMKTTFGDTDTFLKRKAGVETAKEKMQ